MLLYNNRKYIVHVIVLVVFTIYFIILITSIFNYVEATL